MLQKLVTDYNVAVLGCSEVNLNWHELKQSEQWAERSMGLWECFNTSLAFNTEDEAAASNQRGGCLQVVKEKDAVSWIESEKDLTGLGRWTWTCHRGKHNVNSKNYTAY